MTYSVLKVPLNPNQPTNHLTKTNNFQQLHSLKLERFSNSGII